MKYKLFSALIIAAVLFVTACNKSDKPTVKSSASSQAMQAASSVSTAALKPIEFAGVNLRTANRQMLEEAFAREFKATLVPRNTWESMVDARGMLVGAEKADLVTTKNGAFASIQFTFPNSGDAKQVARVQQMVEAKYGKPTAVADEIGQGEYRAFWDMEGEFLIQVTSGDQKTATYLMFVSNRNFAQMRDEYQDMLNTAPKPKPPINKDN